MKVFHFRLHRLAGLLTIPALLIGPLAAGISRPALAQSPITGGILGPGSATSGGAQQSGKPEPRRPSALPGARTEKGEPAPPDRMASDMAPTEALFDGINRGDLAAVKDAISRGAELNGRNILGLTPIDLSVDLGYNDITFLLLSLRGSEPRSRAAPPAGARAKAELQALAKAEARSAKAAKAERQAAPAPPAAPKLFANDGGAPLPHAGFLGFGPQR